MLVAMSHFLLSSTLLNPIYSWSPIILWTCHQNLQSDGLGLIRMSDILNHLASSKLCLYFCLALLSLLLFLFCSDHKKNLSHCFLSQISHTYIHVPKNKSVLTCKCVVLITFSYYCRILTVHVHCSFNVCW